LVQKKIIIKIKTLYFYCNILGLPTKHYPYGVWFKPLGSSLNFKPQEGGILLERGLVERGYGDLFSIIDFEQNPNKCFQHSVLLTT